MKNLFLFLFSMITFALSAQEADTILPDENAPLTMEDIADAKAAAMIEKFGFPNSIRTRLTALKLVRMQGIEKAKTASGFNREEVVRVNRTYKIELSRLLTPEQYAMVQKDWDQKWEKMKETKAVKSGQFDELKDE